MLSLLLALFALYPIFAEASPNEGEQARDTISIPESLSGKTILQLSMLGYRITAPMEVDATAYDACILCCGKSDGITKTGQKALPWYTVAVDPDVIPLGTKVYVPAFGRVFEAQDIGGKIRGRRMDFFLPDHESAISFGRQPLQVFLLSGPEKLHRTDLPQNMMVWAPTKGAE
ncbi:hypothetical protein GJ688_18685 [Heliobacillus mobilis]|uniref:3D domain-containing protein n=1 Tax=Heliobacterium mobile TaxID=28064 RepID=A0A6I3SQF3_HELMO|nr:3D domain-containing protein [Heliobacterium mobile]MTV50946.1 hypothetical protein [Heliobacterium mobile]